MSEKNNLPAVVIFVWFWRDNERFFHFSYKEKSVHYNKNTRSDYDHDVKDEEGCFHGQDGVNGKDD